MEEYDLLYSIIDPQTLKPAMLNPLSSMFG